MNDSLPLVYIARHGETPWSITGQHTGVTDLPLTPRGEQNAGQLRVRLAGFSFAKVWTSPLQRAKRTCELAGFGSIATEDAELIEWDCGDYEGITPDEIQQRNPDWNIFRDGCPNGETLADVASRADHVIERIRATEGDVLLFAHKHFLQVFAACWLGLPPETGHQFFLDTAALSSVGYHHNERDPVMRLWNDRSHISEHKTS